MKSEDVLLRLIKKYGVRRAMVLFGAASVAAQRGWDALVAPEPEGYTRQGVWTWKRDIEAAGIDPFGVEWTGFEKRFGTDVGKGLEGAKVRIREKKAAQSARAARGRAST